MIPDAAMGAPKSSVSPHASKERSAATSPEKVLLIHFAALRLALW